MSESSSSLQPAFYWPQSLLSEFFGDPKHAPHPDLKLEICSDRSRASGTPLKRLGVEQQLGRAAAYKALVRLGFSSPPLVPRGERGMPLWPEGVVGSITHCAGTAVAAVGKTTRIRSVGIDLQSFRSLKVDIGRKILSPRERAWCETVSGEYDQRLLAIFSGKESIYKAYYPLVRRMFGFHAVEFTPGPDAEHFLVEFQEALSEEVSPGQTCQCRVQLLAGGVFSSVVLLSEGGRRH